MGLDAEEIKDTVENMYKTLYKLSKTFFDVPGSKRVAETVRAKVDKFKHSLPVLQAICTPGIQERHWKDVSHKRVALYIYKCSCTSNFNFLQISDAIGMELHPTEETTLADMIEYGLSKYIAKLEEVSLAASREFTLEKNLKKMKDEWAEVTFELMQFRFVTWSTECSNGSNCVFNCDVCQNKGLESEDPIWSGRYPSDA